MYKFLYFVLVVIVTAGFWVAIGSDINPLCLIPYLGGIILTIAWAIWCKPERGETAISIILSFIPGFGPIISFFILVGKTPDYIGKSNSYWVSSEDKAKQQQKVGAGFCGLILFIVLILAGYSGIRYLIDKSQYNKGHQAYLQTDCITAIQQYDKVLNGFRLFNIGGFPALIQPEKEECMPLQVADYNQSSGNPGEALVNYVDFANSYTGNVLADAPRTRIASLFEQPGPSTLASPATCQKIPDLLAKELIPQPEIILPLFYFACGQAYDNAKDTTGAFTMYRALLAEFPQHEHAREAEAALLVDPESCEQADTLQKDAVISQRDEFMPSLYNNCSLMYEKDQDFENAFAMQLAFLSNYPEHSKAANIEKALLANPASCGKTGTLEKDPIIKKRSNFLPTLFYSCGIEADRVNDEAGAFSMYKLLLEKYPDHPLSPEAEAALLANSETCSNVSSLQGISAIANRPDFMLNLYYQCAKSFDRKKNSDKVYEMKAYEMYEALLMRYPEHAYAAEAQQALLSNATSCDRSETLKNKTVIQALPDFMSTLYYNCGQIYEQNREWKNATRVYESFLADYPKHELAEEVEASLARVIIEDARASGAGEIPPPNKSGSTGGGLTEVEIQNDSPESLRIVFSGPEARVEYLEACETCTTYGFSPLYCPEEGPIGKYKMAPGEYAVVVESTSDKGTTPWLGDWTLVKGDKYYSCFIIITSFSPR
jgi:hypothetical protein